MTAELPRPQSIWCYRNSTHQARVIYSSENDIITHNCELGKATPEMMSWRGNIHQFHQTFVPGDPTHYPATAH